MILQCRSQFSDLGYSRVVSWNIKTGSRFPSGNIAWRAFPRAQLVPAISQREL